MSLCAKCGNEIVADACAPDPDFWTHVCLVCQHTGRAIECMGFDPAIPGTERTATEIRLCQRDLAERHARNLASALDAVYGAISGYPVPCVLTQEEVDARLEFQEAQARLAQRIADPSHNREKPDWGEEDRKEQDREPVCQSCLGTGRYGNRLCPDCYEPE